MVQDLGWGLDLCYHPWSTVSQRSANIWSKNNHHFRRWAKNSSSYYWLGVERERPQVMELKIRYEYELIPTVHPQITALFFLRSVNSLAWRKVFPQKQILVLIWKENSQNLLNYWYEALLIGVVELQPDPELGVYLIWIRRTVEHDGEQHFEEWSSGALSEKAGWTGIKWVGNFVESTTS